MKALLTGLSCVCAIGLACAADLYVEKDNPSADDTNPGTEAAPFRSIQAAVTFAAAADSGYDFAAGDTIWVKPGVYDEGGYVDGNGYTNRVWFAAKCRVEATGSKADTAIVGCRDPEPGMIGPGAVRCVRCPAAGKGSILRGFTIRNGCVHVANSDCGGGVNASGAGTDFYVADCDFLDNYAFRAGAMQNGTAVRCYFNGNGNIEGTLGSTAQDAYMIYCVIYGSGRSSNSNLMRNGRLVNCTVMDCSCGNGNVIGVNQPIYNSIALCGSGAANSGMGTVTDSVVSSNGRFQVVSPVLQDFRPLSASAAVGTAKFEHLELVPYPEELGRKDYLGADVPTSGSLNCGAIQEVVTPVAGRLTFSNACNVDGKDGYMASYVHPTAFPTQYCVKAAAGTVLFGLENQKLVLGSNSVYGPYPDWRGACYLMPPPAGEQYDYSVVSPGAELYVSDADGEDTNAGTKDAPFKTLAKAASSVTQNRTIIYVQPGTYDDEKNGAYRMNLTASKLVSVRGVEGPEKTVIAGGEDVGCVRFSYLGHMTGVTLTGARNAAAFSAVQPLTIIADCVVSNNVSDTVLSGGVLQRDLVCGNTASSYVWNSNFACGTVFAHNVGGRIAYGGTQYNCTVFGNETTDYLHSGARFVNSVLQGPGTCNGKNLTSFAGSYFCDLDAGSNLPADAVTDDTMLVANGVPLATSPVLGGGAYATDGALTNALYRILASGGPDTPRIAWTADGRATAGAWQRTKAVGAIIEAPSRGGLTVSGASFGENLIADGESLPFTLTRTSDGERWCRGLDVNGAFVDFDDWPSGWSHTVSSGATSVKVKPVYSTVLYAAPNGTDGNDGFSRATPKTLQGALGLAVSGETVVALRGVYDTGKTKVSETDAIWSRAVVRAGVTLASDEGAEKTFIVGEASADEMAKSGCGTGAVRCVRFTESGGRIRGFTLTGGHSGPSSAGAVETGPAVFCKDNSAYIENCVISNNTVAYRGGCYYGTYVNCQFLANKALSGADAPALYYGVAIGCLIDHNRGNCTTEYSSALVNCTFGRDNLNFNDTSTAAVWAPNSGYKTYNCLFLNGAGGSNSGVLKNCVFASDVSGNLPDPATYAYGCENVVLKPFAQLGVDEEGCPLSKDAVTVDRGVKALYDAYGTQAMGKAADVADGQRVYNAAIDVGAFEYDWRPDFGAILGRKVTVSEMSPEVTTNAAGQVCIPAGTFAFARTERTDRERGYVLDFGVTGSGALTVAANGGTPQTFGAGSHTVELKAASATFNLAYAPGADDAGGAVLTSFSREGDGLMMIVR